MSSLAQGPISIPRTGEPAVLWPRTWPEESQLCKCPGEKAGSRMGQDPPFPSTAPPLPLLSPPPASPLPLRLLEMAASPDGDPGVAWLLNAVASHLLTADLLAGAWPSRPPLHHPPPPFLWKSSLISLAGGLTWKAPSPSPGASQGRAVLGRAGHPPRGAAGLSCILSLLPLLPLLLPSPPPPAPLLFSQGHKGFSPSSYGFRG